MAAPTLDAAGFRGKVENDSVAKASELGVTENVAILDDGGNLISQ
jgi:hypothetical protein